MPLAAGDRELQRGTRGHEEWGQPCAPPQPCTRLTARAVSPLATAMMCRVRAWPYSNLPESWSSTAAIGAAKALDFSKCLQNAWSTNKCQRTALQTWLPVQQIHWIFPGELERKAVNIKALELGHGSEQSWECRAWPPQQHQLHSTPIMRMAYQSSERVVGHWNSL